jgi:hypothetical protein
VAFRRKRLVVRAAILGLGLLFVGVWTLTALRHAEDRQWAPFAGSVISVVVCVLWIRGLWRRHAGSS